MKKTITFLLKTPINLLQQKTIILRHPVLLYVDPRMVFSLTLYDDRFVEFDLFFKTILV